MMTCPHCRAQLTQRNRVGEGLIRNRGIVIKADGPVLICPKCRGNVRFDPQILTLAPLVVFRTPREPR
jgi:uncharacterized protein YbaR (Trm112 family)